LFEVVRYLHDEVNGRSFVFEWQLVVRPRFKDTKEGHIKDLKLKAEIPERNEPKTLIASDIIEGMETQKSFCG
jgi:hypothetical protein